MHDPSYDGAPSALRFRWIHLLNATLLVGLWWWSWRVFHQLPDQIPGHIGVGGVRWDDTTLVGWMLLPMIAGGMTILNYGLGPLIRRSRRVNLPSGVRFEDLLRDDQDEVLDLTAGFLRWMNAILVGGFWILQLGAWEMATGSTEGIAGSTLVGILYLVLIPNLASVAFLTLMLRAVGDAERRAQDAALSGSRPDPSGADGR